MLELKGCIVTIDAMGCQKDIARGIVARKADYVLAVKGNQDSLHNALLAAFAQLDANPPPSPTPPPKPEEGPREKGSRRRPPLMQRRTSQPRSYSSGPSLKPWPGFNPRPSAQARPSRKNASTSAPCVSQVETIANSVRSHWGIENELHWVLDVAFREDDPHAMGNGPETGAILRHITLNMLRQDPNTKRSIKFRRMQAAISPDYRLAALFGFSQGPSKEIPG